MNAVKQTKFGCGLLHQSYTKWYIAIDRINVLGEQIILGPEFMS